MRQRGALERILTFWTSGSSFPKYQQGYWERTKAWKPTILPEEWRHDPESFIHARHSTPLRIRQATPQLFERLDTAVDKAVDKIAAGNLRDGSFDLLRIKNVLSVIRQTLPDTDPVDDRIEMIENIQQSIRPISEPRLEGFGTTDPEDIEEEFKAAMQSGGASPELIARMLHRHDPDWVASEEAAPFPLLAARKDFQMLKESLDRIMSGRVTADDMRRARNQARRLEQFTDFTIKMEPSLVHREEAVTMKVFAQFMTKALGGRA